jgi:predicted O-methyltransferase YrrM
MITKDLLKQNISALSHFDKAIYLAFIRPFRSKAQKLFFEGCLFLPGQMYAAEREGLYDSIREMKPDYCFEIGTWTGGGSTFFISKALKDNNKGKLFTIENYEPLHKKAIRRYKKFIKGNFPFIDFILSSTPKVFEKYLKEENKSHMIFLDGAEDGAQTLEQYYFFKPYFKKGTVLALHDWNTEKTIKVKPVIQGDQRWKKVIELGKPESIGFAVFKYE